MASARTTRTPKKRAAFLAELAARGNVSDAAAAAGVPRQTVYDWRAADPAFAAAWDAALDQAADTMEREAFRRAVEGVAKPLTSMGKVLTQEVEVEVDGVKRMVKVPLTIQEYSDTLLIFLLKGARPEKYRERQQVEHTGRLEVEYVNDWRDPTAE